MSPTAKIRVLCVDDHAVVREGIGAIINLQPDMTLVASASTGREALEQYRTVRPDVTLMDLRMSDMTGFDAIRAIRAEFQDARIIVLSSYEGDADIRQALDAGARGYVAKGMVREELLAVIRSVHAGKRRIPAELAATLAEHLSDDQLSAREVEVLQLVSAGKLNKEIAADLSLAEGTVKMHVGNILSKLGASDRTEAVTVALRRGIIRL
jgi:DNA-binding NarL/FixJ family response regulator